MSFRALPLPDDVSGRLWLHSMPGRRESWSDFLDQARHQQLNLVVCLNPLDEVEALSPQYFKAIQAGRLPFRWMHLPMLNFGLASEAALFRQGVEQLAHGLRLGDRALVHCAAGMGRTGTMGACVLKRLGRGADDAVQTVREAGSNPQSAVQTGWIQVF
ncbi:protein-tyrosine phosphatase family protein [Roseateles terrae]|uniref:Protein-tyrosine phosphatase n=1 Tax=Roseateles terrae TaxID=431060 RepID=A0ABR6GPZ9_9BURK|nr:tyrosine-protein phosphatase [Roseateles terrae]MBB3194205.1 protein-tyrosine phosphatase [Roseateles terrae]OWQ88054.1 phosphatase [Roseateles terrae]